MDDAVLLREAIRAAETHEWLRNQLMRDKNGRMVFAAFDKLMARGPDVPYTEAEPIECDEVVACCAVGYLRYADVCLLPVTGGTVADTVLELLERLLWSKPEVREACRNSYDTWKWGDADDDMEEFVEREGPSVVGDEGLVPFWNDEIAESRDDVVALFTEALESITPA